jgi:hypothetical protein
MSRQETEWEAVNSLAAYDRFVQTYPESGLLQQRDQKLATLEPEIQTYLARIARDAASDSKILTGSEIPLPGVLPEYAEVTGVLWHGPFPQVLSQLGIRRNHVVDHPRLHGDPGSMTYSFAFRMPYPRAQFLCADSTIIAFYSHPNDELEFSSGTVTFPTAIDRIGLDGTIRSEPYDELTSSDLSYSADGDPPMTLRGFDTLAYARGVGVVVVERPVSKSVYTYALRAN